MHDDDSFDRLARRDVELNTVAARGRRRSIGLMVVMFVALGFIITRLNHDTGAALLIAMTGACVGTIVTCWYRWRRHPEDAQSVAFLGLDRTARGSAYRSMWRSSGVEDPVVLTILESMHHHQRRSFPMVAAAMSATAVLGIALVQGAGSGISVRWVSVGIIALLGTAIGLLRLITNRAGVVIGRSRPITLPGQP